MFYFVHIFKAIHQFLLEVHINAWGLDSSYRGLDALDVQLDFVKERLNSETVNIVDDTVDGDEEMLKPYNGQYDNLLFFFTHMYKLIHTYYDHNDLKAYKRPIK